VKVEEVTYSSSKERPSPGLQLPTLVTSARHLIGLHHLARQARLLRTSTSGRLPAERQRGAPGVVRTGIKPHPTCNGPPHRLTSVPVCEPEPVRGVLRR
jgi:hypothetical protein